MDAPRLDQLLLKGSHNSYEANRGAALAAQVDDFGVWAVELDYGVVGGTLVVGHDGVGWGADDSPLLAPNGSYYFRDYLSELRHTEAFKYRPLLIYLDNKGRENEWGDDLADEDLVALLRNDFEAVFSRDQIFTPILLHERFNDEFPDAPALAGFVIPIDTNRTPTEEYEQFQVFPENQFHALAFRYCADPSTIFSAFPRREVDGSRREPVRVWRSNNITDEWTFEYGAPPNPLVVDPEARRGSFVPRCGGTDHAIILGPQGTRLLPDVTIADAVIRARQPISYSDDGRTFRNLIMGIGFTVLAAPGKYADPLRIDFRFTIRADHNKILHSDSS
jgi:hypothetical protein